MTPSEEGGVMHQTAAHAIVDMIPTLLEAKEAHNKEEKG